MNRALLGDRRSDRSPIGLRPSMLVFLYRRRLRAHPVQELLAGTGIAVGVALVFGVLLANAGLTNSASQLIRSLSGSAQLTLAARSASGFPQRLEHEVAALPGVQVATPVLRENMTIAGPRGRQSIQLIGVAPSLAALGGIAQQQLGNGALLLSGGLGVPGGIARSIGVARGSRVRLIGNGYLHSATVAAVVDSESLKAIAGCPVAVAVLGVAQRLAERPGRITQVLVKTSPGAQAKVTRELSRLAGGRLNVEPADGELGLLAEALKPNRDSSALFSAISVMVGFLLAVNAMLLTVPERRRFLAELRMQGYGPAQVLLTLGFQAVVLGLVASAAGIALGDLLSHTVYRQVPGYLQAAFPVSNEQRLQVGIVLLALACGVLATVLASLSPVLDLRPGRPADSVFREASDARELIGEGLARRATLAGLALIALVGVMAALVPAVTILGGVVLALATVCLIPLALTSIARVLPRLTERARSGAMIVAVSELRAITARSVALAAIAAIAVYGSVAIGGARDDLLRGIDQAISQYHSTAAIWVTDSGNVFNTEGFEARSAVTRLRRAPGVAAVRVYQGALLDVASRRLWVRARPAGDATMIEPSQLLQGDLETADRRIRRRGWAAVSSGFAEEHHLTVGGAFTLPAPSGPALLRVAAVTTNSGWPAGTITLGGADYTQLWQSREAAALEINLSRGTSMASGLAAVHAALRSRPGLWIAPAGSRAGEAQASARQGLHTLGQISTLLIVAAALAVAAALSASVWQRRVRLASLKIQGYHPAQLWGGLLIESATMLGIGALLGATVGVYGHALASRWLTGATGFPAPFSFAGTQILLTLALISAITLAVMALPGLAAASVPARASLQE
jgi:putative ABC transport system permease protein